MAIRRYDIVKLGPDEVAKYPFLPESRDYLTDSVGFSLEAIGMDPDLQTIVDAAYERVVTSAINSQIYASGTSGAQDAHTLKSEILSFLVAVILIKLSKMPTLVNRFALNEARRAETILERDLKALARQDQQDLAIELVRKLFSVGITRQNTDFVLAVSEYVPHAVGFHERHWKLVNRRVSRGMVYLTPHETVRLVRAELQKYIRDRIQAAAEPSMYPNFEKPVQGIIALTRERFPAEPAVQSKEYPPCIKHAIDVLERGENLPHSGRFMLGAFLLNRGQSVEQIAPLFRNAPDYNERTTLYQLNNIADASGDGKPYNCPSCEKVRGNNLCFPVEQCNGIVNPLQFGRRR